MKKRKNILIIVVDCLGANFVYEESKAYIPTIKKLRENGYSFLNTITSTTTTTPSFAGLLTGMYPFQNGVRSHSGYSLKKEIITLPQILKENGYNTYAEVTGPLTEKIDLSRGFDEYNFRSEKETIHIEYGIDLLKKFDEHYKSPWFVMLHIWALHEPRIIIKECNSKKYSETLYGRALASIDNYLKRLLSKVNDDTIIIFTGDHGEQIANSKYNRFFKKSRVYMYKILKKVGLIKVHFGKAISSFAIGHGFNVYDVLVKVPLIFYHQDLISKGESSTQIRQIDIFPTILDLLDLKYKNKVEGKSLLPLINGKKEQNREAYIEAVGLSLPNKDEWISGLRVDNKYKYIFYPFKNNFEEELYDLEKDPEEKYNIARENKDLIKTFRKRIEEMKTEKFTGEKLSEEDQKKIEKRLKDLGYMD